ncbi:Auxin-induced protein X15 [Bienertia sinuspersici]
MAIHSPSVVSNARQMLAKNQQVVPKGHIPIYIGQQAGNKKRYVVPLSYLSHPAFQDMLHLAEEETGFNHPLGCLTIPCSEEAFFELTCDLNC